MRLIIGALGVAALAVLAAGCFGGSGTARPARPDTRVVIQTPVGGPARRIAELDARCPAQARCRPERVPGSRPRQWALRATRTLICDPDRGDYRRPAIACRALRDLARLEAHPTGIACGCPVMPVPPPTIVGRVDGKHVAFTLGCGLCGLPARASADAGVLIPA
jgi:hypothetical protein